jgi:hypothetical protein
MRSFVVSPSENLRKLRKLSSITKEEIFFRLRFNLLYLIFATFVIFVVIKSFAWSKGGRAILSHDRVSAVN